MADSFFRRWLYIRCVSSNLANRIPEETQLMMWYMVDTMDEDKDWLQIFNLTIKDGVQYIEHQQEEPKCREECVLLTNNPVEEKVYIILEPGLSTMILAEDY